MWPFSVGNIPAPAQGINIGDRVGHIRYPGRYFIVTRIHASAAGIEYTIQDALTGDPMTTEEAYLFLQPASNEPIAANRQYEFCLTHKRSKDPMRLPEKHFEAWYVCTKCGEAMYQFDPDKTQPIDVDDDLY